MKVLSAEGVKTNVTLIFTANQALLAARAGATYVSPFLGRLDDISVRGVDLISEIAQIFEVAGIETEIIAASVRNPMHITDCALAGADIATVPYKVIEQMTHHPLTDAGIKKFREDYIAVFGELKRRDGSPLTTFDFYMNGRVRMSKTGKIKGLCMIAVLLIVVCTSGCSELEQFLVEDSGAQIQQVQSAATLAEVPEYSGEPYVEINDNQPEFEDYELTAETFEEYSELDELGRCGAAEACVGEETMPTEERGDISSVKPTGWKNKDYDNVDGGRLYNRCHLIGFQLTGENANEKNLITGTRYMNTEGMLPFENMVADYVHETDNHVLYRVTPIFDGEDLVASGVQMEAESVEDDGAGVCFNVYVYNVQPQITINYATGDNWESDTAESDKDLPEYDETDRLEEPEGSWAEEEQTYILNVNSHKFHLPECSGANDMKEQNKREFTGTRSELIEEGYEPCGSCNP